MKKGFILIALTLSVGLILISFTLFKTSHELSSIPIPTEEEAPVIIKEPEVKFGMIIDSLDVEAYKIQRNQTMLEILTSYNLPREKVFEIFRRTKPVYNLANIHTGNRYRVYLGKDSARSLKCFVYEANPMDHIVIKLTDSIEVFKEEKQIDTTVRSIGGMITSSLYETLTAQNASPELPVNLAAIFAWQVDFFQINEGDNFKVIYEEILVDGQPVKMGKIIAASFQQAGKDYYAINFKEDGEEKFFNEEGKNVRGAFLKSPLKFFRITSRFSKRRFHPVQKRYKAHLGTDYAAPTGTPILAVGSGTVVEARYNRFNGNYVKIKHNGTYSTQYLHMSRIKKGIRRGRRVSQGEVIGYVGSTGLATGPHVCFRFWKNGKQVDPRGVKVMESDPIKKANRPEFEIVKEEMMKRLNAISFQETEIVMNK